MIILYILVIFWSVHVAKQILFWLYLWQLKEYHIGRFLDHFRTAKGRQIFLNPLYFIKVVLLLTLGYGSLVSVAPTEARLPLAGFWMGAAWLLLSLYFLENAKAFLDVARETIKLPVFTEKIIFLTALALASQGAFLAIFSIAGVGIAGFILGFLLFDIFTPLIVSAIVLAFQPFAVLGRRRIIQRAKRKREIFGNLTTVGITGSYGKTSTKEFLALILEGKFRTLKTREHQNSEIGLAQCILNDLKSEHEIFIAEMGAYGKGGIKLLCDIVKPKIGIITGINEQHLALFGSMENLLSAEGGGELIESLPEEGVAIVNWDNKFIKSQITNFKLQTNHKSQTTNHKVIKYSVAERTDIWVEDIRTEKEYVSFHVLTRDGDAADFRVNVLGGHYVPNLLAAVACAKELGMTMTEIAEACEKITPELSGMMLKKGIRRINIIDSTYSANPDGVIAHLEYLKIWPGKKGIIMPCLIELGKASKEVHWRIGRKIGEVCDLAIITTKERFSDIKSGAVETGMQEENVLFLEKWRDIVDKIKDTFGSNDVLLLEGRISKQITNNLIV